MKRLVFLTLLLASAGLASGQQDYKFSFPSPEIRVDTIRPLSAYRLSIIKPLNVTGSLSVKGTRLPSMFMFECVDSINNHRFALTKNGYLISGTHHNPATNVDGLAMMGRGNSLFGADAVAIGKQVVNEADTTMALGYYYTVPETKHNMTIIGYGGNRIEMAADSGRFVGNWKLGTGGSGGIITESDPTVPSHVKSITTTNVANWNTAYTNSHTHSNKGVLDGVTSAKITNWDAAFGWGDHSTQGYLKSYTETDPTIGSHIKGITTMNVTNWNTAFGWGNHATQGYLKSYTETDPVWIADKPNYYTQAQTKTLVKDTAAVLRSLIKIAAGGGITQESDPTVPSHVKSITTTNVANWNIAYTNSHTHSNKGVLDGVTSAKITNWDAAFGWGDHSAQGYLKSYTETDPTIGSHIKAITTTNVANWNTAFGWGNHSTQGYLKTIPVASATTSGTIKIGSGLSISGDGILSTSSSGGMSSVATSNSGTVLFTGDGTSATPLSATVPNASRGGSGVITLPTGSVTTRYLFEDGTFTTPSIIEKRSGNIYSQVQTTNGTVSLSSQLTASSYSGFTLNTNVFTTTKHTTIPTGTGVMHYPLQIEVGTVEPNLSQSGWCIWVDGSSNIWLVVNYNGTQKKVQLQ